MHAIQFFSLILPASFNAFLFQALESVRVRAKRIADQLYAQAERRMSVRIAMEGGRYGSIKDTVRIWFYNKGHGRP